MWTKTLYPKFKGQVCPVQVWLSDTTEDNKEVVKVQAMLNEFYLEEEILFSGRDNAYDFIKTYPIKMASSFVLREAYNVGAVE